MALLMGILSKRDRPIYPSTYGRRAQSEKDTRVTRAAKEVAFHRCVSCFPIVVGVVAFYLL
jgi:hypothetical protein